MCINKALEMSAPSVILSEQQAVEACRDAPCEEPRGAGGAAEGSVHVEHPQNAIEHRYTGFIPICVCARHVTRHA
jgi:hypothetical protein